MGSELFKTSFSITCPIKFSPLLWEHPRTCKSSPCPYIQWSSQTDTPPTPRPLQQFRQRVFHLQCLPRVAKQHFPFEILAHSQANHPQYLRIDTKFHLHSFRANFEVLLNFPKMAVDMFTMWVKQTACIYASDTSLMQPDHAHKYFHYQQFGSINRTVCQHPFPSRQQSCRFLDNHSNAFLKRRQ